MKKFSLICLVVASLLPLACGDDDPVSPQKAAPSVKDLTQKSDVLNNIEYAYSHPKDGLTVYDNLLDATEFTFFYTEGDVGGGGVPVQWGRADEMKTTMGLFNAASRIELDIQWEGQLKWSAFYQGDEEWFTTTVFYNFLFNIGPDTWLNPGAQAQFTVRNTGTDQAPHWQLVEFRDLAAVFSAQRVSNVSTENSTWGQVKSLYR